MLHKKLFINRGADQIVTWCYPLEKRVTYTYSDVIKRKEPAFTTVEVGKMLHRSKSRLKFAIANGFISEPQYTYGLSEVKQKHQHMWSEENIMEAHDYFLTVHRGKPRKDKKITPQFMPSKREIRAMIRQEEVLYVKDESGEFKPVWRAQDFS